MMERQTAVLIIDTVEIFREGLRRLLFEAGFQPVWCSDRPPIGPVPDLGSQSSPLVIIGNEIEEAILQLGEVKHCYPASCSVLLLEAPSAPQLSIALRNGAVACLSRDTSCEILLHALRLVMDGSAVFPSDLLGLLASAQPPVVLGSRMTGAAGTLQSRYGLSARELMVVPHLRGGLSNKEIARELGITEATVKVHVKALLRKAGLRNRTQLAMWVAGIAAEPPITAESAAGSFDGNQLVNSPGIACPKKFE